MLAQPSKYRILQQVLLKPRVAMMLFKAPLTSNSKSSTKAASAASVWRRTSLEAGVRRSVSAVAAVTAVVMASMFVMKAAAAVAFCVAVEFAVMPAAVSSI